MNALVDSEAWFSWAKMAMSFLHSFS
jgi:hypothetical protein